MNKHTPGPWRTVIGYDGSHTVLTGKDYSLECVALIKQTQSSKADAHLIAAAPEMLDTLKHIEFILENYKLSGYRADEISEKYLEMVRHAIAKAEGKES